MTTFALVCRYRLITRGDLHAKNSPTNRVTYDTSSFPEAIAGCDLARIPNFKLRDTGFYWFAARIFCGHAGILRDPISYVGMTRIVQFWQAVASGRPKTCNFFPYRAKFVTCHVGSVRTCEIFTRRTGALRRRVMPVKTAGRAPVSCSCASADRADIDFTKTEVGTHTEYLHTFILTSSANSFLGEDEGRVDSPRVLLSCRAGMHILR